MAEPNPTRLPALDLLRFTAAIGVALYHYVSCYPKGAEAALPALNAVSAVTRYGYLGVDLFFMISGFVILWSSMNSNPLGFAISRASRLYPSFWASIVFTVLCILLIGPLVPQVDLPALTPRMLAANATMLPAIFNAPLLEGVYWTLEIEIRFYALIFVLLLFRSVRRIEPLLYAWIALTLAACFVKMPWVANYFGLIPYGAFFASGSLFYLVLERGWSIARVTGLIAGLGTSMLVSIDQRGGFITADAESAIVVPALVAVFFGLFVWLVRRRSNRQSRVSYWLGALTYPLYLTHAMMGHLLYEYLYPKMGVTLALLTITALALVVAIALTIGVDIPARKPFARLLDSLAQWARLKPRPVEAAQTSGAGFTSPPAARGPP